MCFFIYLSALRNLKKENSSKFVQNYFTAKALNVRSLDKQDSVEIKEWLTKKLTGKQVQHKGIEL